MQEKINNVLHVLSQSYLDEVRDLEGCEAMQIAGGVMIDFYVWVVESIAIPGRRTAVAAGGLEAMTKDILTALKRKESNMLNFTPNVTADEISLTVGGFNEAVLPSLDNVDGNIQLVVGTGILEASIELFEGILAQLVTIRDDAATSGVG